MYPTVRAYYVEQGYDVYAEVGTCDVVAERNGEQTSVELKLHMTKDLCRQILELKRYRVGNYFSVVVPKPKTQKEPKHYQSLVREGIGIYYYTEAGLEERNAPTYYKAKYYRKLKEVHKELIGGVKSGEGDTPYKRMIAEVKAYMKSTRNWESVQEIYDKCPKISEHYGGKNKLNTFRNTLGAGYNRHWVESKKIGNRVYYRYNQKEKKR